jgi:hypothetical protein
VEEVVGTVAGTVRFIADRPDDAVALVVVEGDHGSSGQ